MSFAGRPPSGATSAICQILLVLGVLLVVVVLVNPDALTINSYRNTLADVWRFFRSL